ncbi:MAG TPA: VOC family protein [Actinotalea caeni]|uniref:VOC family protein n=1 Tax=Actinotalea caeni TaxID=1348467 RepID=UPI0012E29145|nr:VOC family protein [Actinotalea caeni]HLV55087.1 VOC family protein [Actinotalea caeni]
MSDSTVRAADIKHWQNITFNDTAVMTAWLAAIGVREHAVYRSEDDPDVIVHGEWIGPGGAGFMGGSAREGAGSPPGQAAAYLVVDDPDDIVERALAAGATIMDPVSDKDYGGRGGTVLDPEGNQWSFGTYQPS